MQCLVCFRIAQDLRHSLVNATANSNASMRAVPEGINEKHSRPGSGKSRDHIVAFLQKGIWKEFSSQTAGEVLLPQKEQQGDSMYVGYTIGGHQNPSPSAAFPGTRSDEYLKRDYCLVSLVVGAKIILISLRRRQPNCCLAPLQIAAYAWQRNAPPVWDFQL